MDRIDTLVHEAIERKVFPGCVIGVSRMGVRDVRSYGSLRYDDARVSPETVYDLASITKSIPTASLALELIDEKLLRLQTPVADVVPDLRHDHGATIEDLLRYRVRGLALSRLAVRTFEEIRTRALEHGFDSPPGETEYTNFPAFILGLLIERVTQASLARLAHERFFGPLAMNATTYFPSASDCAPTEIDHRGEVVGVPHDESTYVFAQSRRTVGHAGLFSTVGDLLTFAERMLFEDTVVARGAREGLGWHVNKRYFMGHHAPRLFGKTGFTGTSIVVEPEQKVALGILSNRTYPHRPSDAASADCAINVFRRALVDMILETS